jgi:short-subunit dehydrogenase
MKTCVILGGTTLIGKAIIKELIDDYKIILIGRNSQKLENIKNQLKDENLLIILNTNTFPNKIEIETKLNGEGVESVDLFISLIGGVGQYFGDFSSLDTDQWLRIYESNTIAPLEYIKIFEKYIIKSENGLILLFGSKAGERPGKYNPHYGIAKNALTYILPLLTKNLGSYGIRVNIISPSLFMGETLMADAKDISEKLKISAEEATQNIISEAKLKNPLKKMVTIDDIVNAVKFIIECKSVNGLNLRIDCGE